MVLNMILVRRALRLRSGQACVRMLAGLALVLAACKPVERTTLPVITIAPGVMATLGWGRGALLERVEMQPGAVYPAQSLAEELIIIVEDGSATVDLEGRSVELG